MKIHLAAISSPRDREIMETVGVKNLLVSYYFKNQRDIFTKKHLSFRQNHNIILDSGAYSAFTKGVDIDLMSYINFIQENNVAKYITLDIINDPVTTMKNTQIMMKHGLEPIVVYHWKTNDIPLLKYYCRNFPYVCIGGTVPIRGKLSLAKKVIEVLDTIPNLPKIHLLGYSSPKGLPLLKDYIYSVDSTTWTIASGFGEIINNKGKREKMLGEKKERMIINATYFKNLEMKINKKENLV